MNFFHSLFASAARHKIPKLRNYNDSVYVFYDPPLPPKGIVIFFHDIHWKEYEEPHVQSWMSSSEPSVCWPQHWLAARYPDMQILSALYDAGIWKRDTTGHMDLDLLAENLMHDILQIYAKSCPVFLVGHGLGGHVIKKLIKIMQEERDKWSRRACASLKSNICPNLPSLDCFLKNVKGVFYYATPFLGSKVISSMKFSPHTSKVLDPLEVLNTDACRLNDWFRNWRQDSHCKATAIFATLPTNVALWYGNCSTNVVEEASARSDVDEFYTSKSDHFNVCRPRDQQDSGFCRLVELIGPHVSTRSSQPTGQIGENIIDKECDELLKNLLQSIAELDTGQAFMLDRDDIRKMMTSPTMLGKLRNGLVGACLELTSKDDNFEYLEPVDDKDEGEHTQDCSPNLN